MEEESSNLYLIGKKELLRLVENQGDYRQFYVELGDNVRINFKHIRPRKRKGEKIPALTVSEGGTLNFD